MTTTNLLRPQTGLPLYCQVEGKTIYQLVIDELEGKVAGKTRHALNDHLLRCATCCGIYSRLKNIIRVVRTYPDSLTAVRLPDPPLHKRKTRKATIL